MDKRIEKTLTEQGKDLAPIREAEHLLGYDPMRAIKAGNLEAVIKQMRREAMNRNVTEGLKRTKAYLTCIIADYITRKGLSRRTEKDTDTLAIEAEVLRQLMIDEPTEAMVWSEKN